MNYLYYFSMWPDCQMAILVPEPGASPRGRNGMAVVAWPNTQCSRLLPVALAQCDLSRTIGR